jgi:hypothetical protein
MATSKSTVVGIRLDHDRRAWVEAEAARLGVSMRGLFEGMIDEARSGGATEASRAIAGLGSAGPAPAPVPPGEGSEADAGAQQPMDLGQPGSLHATSSLSSSSTSPSASSPWAGVGAVTALPTGLIREAFSLTASLIELSGRLATNRLESCVLTRRCGRRSL